MNPAWHTVRMFASVPVFVRLLLVTAALAAGLLGAVTRPVIAHDLTFCGHYSYTDGPNGWQVVYLGHYSVSSYHFHNYEHRRWNGYYYGWDHDETQRC